MKKSITVLTSIILVFLFAVIAVTAQSSDTPVTSNVSFTYELINNDTEYKITGCTSV